MTRPTLVRRTAVLTAVLTAALLATVVVQAAPAAATPGGSPATALSVEARAGYSPIEPDGGPGTSPSSPAQLYDSSALSLAINVTNTGSEAVSDVRVAVRVVTNGVLYDVRCHTYLLPVDDAPPPPQARRSSAPSGASDPWSDPDLVLQPGQTLYCSASIDAIWSGTLHEDISTATATGVTTGTTLSVDDHVWARSNVEEPGPWEASGPLGFGDTVWLDSNHDGLQDRNEPGIAGVRLSARGPVGPDGVLGGVVATQTTDAKGYYYFRKLTPLDGNEHYVVSVDPSSAALEGLTPTLQGQGDDDRRDSSTGSAASRTWVSSDNTLDFGYVSIPTAELTIAIPGTPAAVVAGSNLTIQGTLRRAGSALGGTAALEFKAGGTTTWTTVKQVHSTVSGGLTTAVVATRSGTYRYRYVGDATTTAATSPEHHVTVRTASVTLAVAAPSSVPRGSSVTVAGSITREGKAFAANTVLEFSPDTRTWTQVAETRSTAQGTLSVPVKPSRTGSYRYRFTGSSTTAPGTSPVREVVVLLVDSGGPSTPPPAR